MDILKLRYFLVVARCENMTKAAESLHVAQPAISQAIKKLDDELGVKLFDRVGRNIQLSETGKLFYTKVEPLVKALDDIPQILANEVGQENKTIKINVLAAQEIVSHIVADYKDISPDTNFILTQSIEDEGWDIRISSNNDSGDNCTARIALSEEIMLAVPKELQLSETEKIRLSDVKHVSFISLNRNKAFSVQTASFCLAAGFEPMIVFEAESPSMISDLVGAGVGASFWPEYTWGDIDNNKVQFVHISDPKCIRDIYVTKKEQAMKSPLKDDFYQFVLDRMIALKSK
jgi:Transcriptional regulator